MFSKFCILYEYTPLKLMLCCCFLLLLLGEACTRNKIFNISVFFVVKLLSLVKSMVLAYLGISDKTENSEWAINRSLKKRFTFSSSFLITNRMKATPFHLQKILRTIGSKFSLKSYIVSYTTNKWLLTLKKKRAH